MSDPKNDLLYRPSLEYKKDYSTTGTVIEEVSYTEIATEAEYENEVSDLLGAIQRVRIILPILPPGMREVLKTPVRGMEYVVGTIDPSDSQDLPVSREVIVSIKQPIETGTVIPDDDDPFSDTIIDPIKLDIKIHDKVDIIDRQYSHDLVSVLKDYALKLESTFAAYANTLLVTSKESGISMEILTDSVYSGNAQDIKDKDNLHLSDSVTRMQIVRDQKVRLFRKLYDIDSTVLHIRACKSTAELRKRYYGSKYRKNGTMLDVGSNAMLAQSRDAYDKKYKENFKNLYKYLNSSVILMDECMQVHLQEMQAKAILIKKEGMDIK